MRKIIVLFVLGAMALLFLGCVDKNMSPETGPVVIGAVYNLSGAQAELDRPSSEGARLAVDEANRAGGVLGRPLELVLVDGESDPKTITAKTNAIFEQYPSVSALIGLSDTEMVLAAAPVAGHHRRLFLTSGATSPMLPAEVPEYLFLACFGDNVQAAAGAEWAYKELPARTVSVIYDESEIYTHLLAKYFEARFTELGGQVVSVLPYTAKNIGPAVAGLKKADLVFLAVWPDEVADGVERLRRAGFKGPILGGDSFDSPELWRSNPKLTGVYYTTHAYLGADSPNPRVIAFRKIYGQSYPNSQPNAFAALGYDTVRLLIAAIERAGNAEAEKVRRSLSEIEHFEGVTGTIGYTGGARIPIKSVSIIGVDRGNLRLVRELMPAKVPWPGD